MKRQKAGPGVGQPSRARSPRDGLGTAPMKSQHASSVAKNSCESGGHQPAYHDEAWETLVSLPNSPLVGSAKHRGQATGEGPRAGRG